MQRAEDYSPKKTAAPPFPSNGVGADATLNAGDAKVTGSSDTYAKNKDCLVPIVTARTWQGSVGARKSTKRFRYLLRTQPLVNYPYLCTHRRKPCTRAAAVLAAAKRDARLAGGGLRRLAPSQPHRQP
ncbi:hypothetical protein MRX96_044778 [Rhipicephalus microplus]